MSYKSEPTMKVAANVVPPMVNFVMILDMGEYQLDTYDTDIKIAEFMQEFSQYIFGNNDQNDSAETSLEEGLLDMWEDCDGFEIDTFNDLKEKFLALTSNIPGKFYYWGVEYDVNLLFIPDSYVRQ